MSRRLLYLAAAVAVIGLGYLLVTGVPRRSARRALEASPAVPAPDTADHERVQVTLHIAASDQHGPRESTHESESEADRAAEESDPTVAQTVQSLLGITLARGRGCGVAEVSPDGPADKAGIKPGDIIIECQGSPVASPMSLLLAWDYLDRPPEVQLVLLRPPSTTED